MVRLWGRSGLGQNSKRDAGERAGGQCVHERDRLLTNQMNRFGKLGRRSSVKSLLCAIIIAVVVVAMFQAPTPAAAQTLKTKPDLKGPTPRLPNGKPDFSGVWARPGAQDLTRTFTNRDGTSNKGEPNPLPFTPWGQAQWDNYNPVKNGDYAGSCMPFGWIRSFTPHPMQILQNNEYISFLFEQSTMFQAVNTEGLPHRKDWPPTWFGDSRGHWDGDTLVIEAVNFNGWAKLGTMGHPMSDQSKLTMTFKRPDMGHIQFKWVLEDSKTYTRPVSNDRVFVLTPDVEVMEYGCMEGNLTSLLEGAITTLVSESLGPVHGVIAPSSREVRLPSMHPYSMTSTSGVSTKTLSLLTGLV